MTYGKLKGNFGEIGNLREINRHFLKTKEHFWKLKRQFWKTKENYSHN